MRRFLTRVLRILAQFVVAGGFTRAIDAWVISLDPAWQLTVLAMTQLTIAIAQASLETQGTLPHQRANIRRRRPRTQMK